MTCVKHCRGVKQIYHHGHQTTTTTTTTIPVKHTQRQQTCQVMRTKAISVQLRVKGHK